MTDKTRTWPNAKERRRRDRALNRTRRARAMRDLARHRERGAL